MKKYFIVLLAFISSTLFAQTSDFDGIWISFIYDDNEEVVKTLLLEIEGEEVIEYGYNSEKDEYFTYSFSVQKFSHDRNNALYYWMNQGGAWSETQSFHISLLNKDEAEIIWTRQVNNIKDNEDNEVWDISGKGTLERVNDNTHSYPFVQAKSSENFTVKSISSDSENTEVVLIVTNDSDEDFVGTFHGPGHEYAMYITDSNRSSKYNIKSIEGAEFDQAFTVMNYENLEVTLFFEPIGDLKLFDIIEPAAGPGAWSFYGVNLDQ